MESFIGVIATFLVTQSPQWCVSKYSSTDTVAAVARWLDRMFPTLLTCSLDHDSLILSDYCQLRNRSSLKAERIDSSIHSFKKPAVLVGRSAPSASRYQWCVSKYGSTDTVAAVARWLDRMFPTFLTCSLDHDSLILSDYCQLRNRSSLKAERIDSSIHNLKKPAVLVAVLPAPRVSRQPYNWLAYHDRNPSINWWLPAYVCVCDAGPVFSRSTLNKVTEK